MQNLPVRINTVGMPFYIQKSKKVYLCRRQKGSERCNGRYDQFGNRFICKKCGKIINAIPDNQRL